MGAARAIASRDSQDHLAGVHRLRPGKAGTGGGARVEIKAIATVRKATQLASAGVSTPSGQPARRALWRFRFYTVKRLDEALAPRDQRKALTDRFFRFDRQALMSLNQVCPRMVRLLCVNLSRSLP